MRYLDLGFNRLGCQNCSDILRAAARGDLESLDFAGNFTQRGGPFLAAVAETLVAMPAPLHSSGKSDGDTNSSDGEDSDYGSGHGGSNNGHGKNSNSSSCSSSGNYKNDYKNGPFRPRTIAVDGLSLRLPRHPMSLSTCHLKHLVRIRK